MLSNNVQLCNKTILVTGAAGFIGSNLVMELLQSVETVNIVGFDNCNNFYDVSLKEYRLSEIEKMAGQYPNSKWTFIKGNLADKALVDRIFDKYKFSDVIIANRYNDDIADVLEKVYTRDLYFRD